MLLIQQYVIAGKLFGPRIAYLIAAKRTIIRDDESRINMRYPITMEIPLNGEKADSLEWFLIINHQNLKAFRADAHDLQVRLSPLIDFLLKDQNTIEVGLNFCTD